MNRMIDIAPCKLVAGTYTGDGNDDRSIDIGVDLSAKSYVICFVIPDYEYYSTIYTDSMGADDAKYGYFANQNNHIQDFNATGFVVGDSTHVNRDTTEFHYIVFYQD